jgi:hypothetical protein
MQTDVEFWYLVLSKVSVVCLGQDEASGKRVVPFLSSCLLHQKKIFCHGRVNENRLRQYLQFFLFKNI